MDDIVTHIWADDMESYDIDIKMHNDWSISITCRERWWNWMGRIVGLSSPPSQDKVVAKRYDEQCRAKLKQ